MAPCRRHGASGSSGRPSAAALEGDRFQDAVKKVPGLAVIASAGKGNWRGAAPELRLSAFAHFVLEGLAGAADADKDDTIDALELFDYVSTSVEQWVRHNRDAPSFPPSTP